MLTATIAAPKISFEIVAMISLLAGCKQDDAFCYRQDWIALPQIPSHLLEQKRSAALRGATDRGEYREVARFVRSKRIRPCAPSASYASRADLSRRGRWRREEARRGVASLYRSRQPRATGGYPTPFGAGSTRTYPCPGAGCGAQNLRTGSQNNRRISQQIPTSFRTCSRQAPPNSWAERVSRYSGRSAKAERIGRIDLLAEIGTSLLPSRREVLALADHEAIVEHRQGLQRRHGTAAHRREL